MMLIDRPPFDTTIEKELLENGFAFYDDWEYGPVSGYSTGHEYYTLYLMKHGYGYYLILSPHASGENPRMNIGSSNNAKEIIAIRDGLSKLF